ncbi:YKR070W-like protein [Saccharomyces cerevisiae FostersO]|nr:YKR070W-like protein [Saccharomyces cerevisiae FostersO]
MEYSRDIPDLTTKKFDAVLVFNDPHDWAADIQIISDAINSENGMLNTLRNEKSGKPSIPIYFSNQDLLWANPYKLNRFGQGAFRLLVRRLYLELNGEPLQDYTLGKPTKLTYDFAHHVLIDWEKKTKRENRPICEAKTATLRHETFNFSIPCGFYGR